MLILESSHGPDWTRGSKCQTSPAGSCRGYMAWTRLVYNCINYTEILISKNREPNTEPWCTVTPSEDTPSYGTHFFCSSQYDHIVKIDVYSGSLIGSTIFVMGEGRTQMQPSELRNQSSVLYSITKKGRTERLSRTGRRQGKGKNTEPLTRGRQELGGKGTERHRPNRSLQQQTGEPTRTEWGRMARRTRALGVKSETEGDKQSTGHRWEW